MIEHPSFAPEASIYEIVSKRLGTEYNMIADIRRRAFSFRPSEEELKKIGLLTAFKEYSTFFRCSFLTTFAIYLSQGEKEIKNAVSSIRIVNETRRLSEQIGILIKRSNDNTRIAQMYVENLIPVDTLEILSFVDSYKPVIEKEAKMLRDRESNPN